MHLPGFLGKAGSLLCLAASLTLTVPSAAEEPAHVTTLGVYKGAGCDGRERLPKFEAWLGRETAWVLEFYAHLHSWEDLLSSARWSSDCWKGIERKKVVSVPMLPEDGKSTLVQGARGDFDHVYRAVGEILVKDGHEDAVIRIGWEFNGNWFPWAAAKDPEAFVAHWRRISQVMRAVPGNRFRFDWTVNAGTNAMNPEKAYPGDEYVDIIGLDAYNHSWAPWRNDPVARWREIRSGPYGLEWHLNFARARGKPVAFPEWGTGDRGDGHGGGDDPLYIQGMAEWIREAKAVYHMYWDYPDPTYDAVLSEGKRPKAAAAFLKAFGPKAE